MANQRSFASDTPDDPGARPRAPSDSLDQNAVCQQNCIHSTKARVGSEERTVLLTALPPTTNKLFYNSAGKGRRKTSQYRAWLRAAGWELRLQKVRPLPGRVTLDISLPDRAGRAPDADNALKASIDLLVRHRLIDGDEKSVVRSVRVQWQEGSEVVQIRIRSADQQYSSNPPAASVQQISKASDD